MCACKGLCTGEKSIKAATYNQMNSKCTECGISLDTLEKRCYCCGNTLRHKRHNILDNRAEKRRNKKIITTTTVREGF